MKGDHERQICFNQFYDILGSLSNEKKIDKYMLLRMDIRCSIAKCIGVFLISGPCEGDPYEPNKAIIGPPRVSAIGSIKLAQNVTWSYEAWTSSMINTAFSLYLPLISQSFAFSSHKCQMTCKSGLVHCTSMAGALRQRFLYELSTVVV